MPILSPLKWIKEAILRAPDQAQRITRVFEELPHVPQTYSPEAVAFATRTTPENELFTLTPGEFRSLAHNLPRDQALPYVNHYQNLISSGDWVDPPPGIFMDHYLERMRKRPFEGFDDLPFLQFRLDPEVPSVGQVTGHEGRHRNLTLEQLFGPDKEWLVRAIPEYNRRDRLPITLYGEDLFSPAIDLSKKRRYASGGIVKSPLQALRKLLTQEKAREALYAKVAPRVPQLSQDHQFITHEMLHSNEPLTVFTHPNQQEAVAAYQMAPRDNGTYLSHMVSFEKGLGSSALEDAYLSAPKKPVYLYSLPGTEGFYRKQPGWVESTEDGISKFTRKAQGGLTCQTHIKD